MHSTDQCERGDVMHSTDQYERGDEVMHSTDQCERGDDSGHLYHTRTLQQTSVITANLYFLVLTNNCFSFLLVPNSL